MQQDQHRVGGWATIAETVDFSDPRDPAALCHRCGVQGTVARALRSAPNRLVLRYCSPCWPAVQHELEERQRIEQEQWEKADAAWFELWERSPQGTAPEPPMQPIWSHASRTWYDVRGFLALLSLPPRGGPGPTSEQLAEIATEIRDLADEMDGPIPPDVQDFLARHGQASQSL